MTTSASLPQTMRQLTSTVTEDKTLRLAISQVDVPDVGENGLLVRVLAAPINPTDLGVLLPPGVDASTARPASDDEPGVVLSVPDPVMGYLSDRVGSSLTAGNEGAGVVVAAGPKARQDLIGQTISFFTGTAFSEYQVVRPGAFMELPEGTDPDAAAAAFVNPQTSIAMVETTKNEGGGAMVMTAAASNLGGMVNRVCQQENLPMVGIVRNAEHAKKLLDDGVSYVCVSSSDSFEQDLTDVLTATGSVTAFDAIGGGGMANTLLRCMEKAQKARGAQSDRYGTTVRKRVHVYGGLGSGPLTLDRSYGMAWSVGAWLMSDYLQTLDDAGVAAVRRRVVEGLDSTFASRYSDKISMSQALDLNVLRDYAQQSTGHKYLLKPAD